MLSPKLVCDELDLVQEAIDAEPFLKLSILDADFEDDTLVLMTTHDVPRPFIRMQLGKVWQGPIEVYCASALMSGFNTELS